VGAGVAVEAGVGEEVAIKAAGAGSLLANTERGWMGVLTDLCCVILISGAGLGCGALQAVRSKAETMVVFFIVWIFVICLLKLVCLRSW
jgi:hypothetical protein